jgi:hypothetical protein
MTRCYDVLSFGLSCLAVALLTIGTLAVPPQQARAQSGGGGCPASCTCGPPPCADDTCSGGDSCRTGCNCVGTTSCKCQAK